MAAIQPTSASIQKNILALSNTSKLFSFIKTIGIIAISILALSAGFYVSGSCILLLEKSIIAHGLLIKTAPYLLKIGALLQKIGRWLFLTISVPTYGICYELPKYFLKKIPLILENIFRHLGKIIINVLDFTYKFIVNTLIPLITKIANFVFKIIDPCIKFIVSSLKILVKNLDQIVKVVTRALKWFNDFVILPIAKWSFKVISSALQTLFDKIIIPIAKRCFSLFKIAQKAFKYIYNHVVIKITEALSFALRKLGQKIQLLVNITVQAFKYIYNHVVIKITEVLSFALRKLGQKIQLLANITVQAFHFVKNKLMLPCLRWSFKVIKAFSNAIFINIIQPIFRLISHAISITKPGFNWFYQKAIKPPMQAGVEMLRIISKQFNYLSNMTIEAIKNLFLEIKKVFEYLSSFFLIVKN